MIGKAVLAALAAAAVAGGAYWWQSREDDGEVRYRLARVERGPMAAVVVASGTLNAVTTVQVGSQISGQVKEIFADFNTSVKKDQIIARIDASTFELRVNQARADLDAAEGAVAVARSGLVAQQAELGRVRIVLADAERDVERKKALVDKKFISPAELEKAVSVLDSTRQQLKAVRAQIKVSEAQVSSARAAVKQRESLLKQAQVDLERTIIRAPVDGTVILRNVDAGQTVAASLQAPVLFTIAQDLRDMQVEAAIDEADVGRLRVGMGASFAVDAFPRRSFSGEIRQIRKSPQNVQNVVSYTVVISAANPDLALLPGMTANVRIVVENRTAALKVPNAALRWRPAGAADPKAPADAPAQQAGGPAVQEFRARLLQELKPSEAQRVQLDEIFSESRQKFARVRDMKGDGNRRREAERIRSETNARIAEILSPAQRPAWERLLAESGSRGRSAAGRVYVLEAGVPKALDGVSLQVDEGEFVALMGPSGSGKSTFMNVLGCLDRPTSGEYRLGGERVSDMTGDQLAAVRNRRIGFVFQHFNLLARTPAIENVELPLVYAGVPKKQRQEKARAMLERVGLGDRAEHHPAQLSGGQQQRVAIARALVTEPLLIFADEPTGALDSRTSQEVMALFQALNRQGMTVVLVTHEADVARHARRILRFRDGRVVEDAYNEAVAA